jgi:hypothetical protein
VSVIAIAIAIAIVVADQRGVAAMREADKVQR